MHLRITNTSQENALRQITAFRLKEDPLGLMIPVLSNQSGLLSGVLVFQSNKMGIGSLPNETLFVSETICQKMGPVSGEIMLKGSREVKR